MQKKKKISQNEFVNPFAFAKRIKRPLILDGAVGSLLQQRGFKPVNSLWSSYALITKPEEVLKIHKQYISAGSDIITTNTFRTNPIVVKKYGKISSATLVKKAMELAKEAAKNNSIYIAGSNPPAEDCYKKERNISYKQLLINHHNHIDLLIDNGSHFILNETQSHFDEIKIICEFCTKKNVPYVLSLYLDSNLKLLSGENFEEIIKFIKDHNPLAMGINCISPLTFKKALRKINKRINWGFYLNCGSGNVTDENITCGISPSHYKNIVKTSLTKEPSFVGSCCGSSPAHIKGIKTLLDESI
jgi:S-methylmethionine-dependent homocysteine/selenocysteine methylase